MKHDFKHFRHSLDDTYMLWRSGGSCLIIYDLLEQNTDEVIPEFWKHHGEITKPISAIASADAYRILGIGIDKDKASVLHYYERNDQKIEIMSEIERRAVDPTGRLY